MISCKYFGPFLDHTGYGDANRAFITALFLAGVDVTTELISQVNEKGRFGWIGDLCTHLEGRKISYKIKICHSTPDLSVRYKELGKYHIQHLFWECDKLPKEWIGPTNQFDEVWTASEQQAQMIKDSGITVPIKWFPQPLDTSVADLDLNPFVVPNFDGLVFLSVFQFILRKNPAALIKTYLKTFEGKDDVCLILKTYGVNYSEKEFSRIREEINKWKKDLNQKHYPKIFLVDELLTNSEMSRLYKAGNTYINTSAGEGWGRPIVEAALMGNSVISTDTTGVADYLPKDLYYPIPTKQVQATQVPTIPWYTSDMQWLDIDQEELSRAMLKVYNDKTKASKMSKKAQVFVKENFNFWKVGQAMKERLEEIERFI